MGPATYFIDVSVINPGANVYRNLGRAEFAGVASRKRALDKKSLYKSHNISNITIIPFVIEAGGRWSVEAATFVQVTCGVKISSVLEPSELLAKRKLLRRRINSILAKGNSALYSRGWDQLKPSAEQTPWSPPT